MYPVDSSSIYTIFPYPSQSQRSSKQLVTACWLLTIGLLVYEFGFTSTDNLSLNLIAGLITIFALLPSHFWCAGRAQGMPIFPLFSLTFIWTYALPLVTPNLNVEAYAVSDRLYAGCTAAGFLAFSTLIWFQFVKSAPRIPSVYRALDNRRGNQFFLGCLGGSVLFNVAIAGDWFSTDFSWFSILRNAVIALTALSAFVLSYRFGNEELSKRQTMLLVVFLISFSISNSARLLLI